MIDIQRIREDVAAYKKVCEYKKKSIDVDKLIQLDDKRKELQLQVDQNKFQQKELAAAQDYEGAKNLKTQIQEIEKEYNQTIEELNIILLQCPNFIHPDVPV